MSTEREIVTVGWDGASQPMRRYRDELHLPDHEREVPPSDEIDLIEALNDDRFFVRSKVRGFVRDCYVTVEGGAAERRLKKECETAERLFKRLGIEASFRVLS